MRPKHEEDFYGWTVSTAQLLRDGKMSEVDFENIIEEIEALGTSEKHQLINRLALVISHLLKWQYQPNIRVYSWVYTIREQRDQARFHLEDSSSLKSKLDEIVARAYKVGVSKAAKDTRLDKKDFPPECPYTFDKIMDEEFYPE
ncbi:MAG: hypothetical protein K0R52_1372 [Alphaproteobacteria bacterium]|jgi:hypothetical protein|nr:hypothetical protein [Alphaproteobacteria bacterium]